MSDEIPLVDFGSFHDGDVEARRLVGKDFVQAAERIGFAVITGHGVPQDKAEELRRVGLRFFDLTMEEKLKVRRPRTDQNRGYIPFGEETLVRMAGGDSPPDYKEVYAIGPEDVPNTPYFSGPDSYPSFAPNLWPAAPEDLKSKLLEYWREMEMLMRKIGRAIALGLDMPEDSLEDVLDERHTSQLRLLHYPEMTKPPEPGQLRAGRHTDLGMITILRNDPVPGGLQVQGRAEEWIDAPALAGSYIINIGDLLMRWSNDRLRSTPHRVVVPPANAGAASRRLSIGYFAIPRYDAMIECLPTCQGPNKPAKYDPISVHNYRTARFAAASGKNKPFRQDAAE